MKLVTRKDFSYSGRVGEEFSDTKPPWEKRILGCGEKVFQVALISEEILHLSVPAFLFHPWSIIMCVLHAHHWPS
jgi:hypothetical protein